MLNPGVPEGFLVRAKLPHVGLTFEIEHSSLHDDFEVREACHLTLTTTAFSDTYACDVDPGEVQSSLKLQVFQEFLNLYYDFPFGSHSGRGPRITALEFFM